VLKENNNLAIQMAGDLENVTISAIFYKFYD